MAEKNSIYKCEICGNVVSVVEAHNGELVCCGKPMVLQVAQTSEQEGKEKHVPVIEETEKGLRVKIGSIPHPMEEDHFIGLVEILKDGEVLFTKTLKPGDGPVADFCCLTLSDGLKARIWCNKHRLWTN